jgi:multidrug efflux pump
MIWSDTCIRRPVMATMLVAALIVFGLIGYARLPVREFPDIDPPVVAVTTVYPGASAEVVETEVTELLEDELNTIEGIRTMVSTSREQVSAITIEFELERNVDIAAQDVRDKIARIRGRLPADIDPPIIAKQDADAQAIMWVALFSNNYSALELTDIAENHFKDRIQNVAGVGQVIIGGAKRFAVRVRLDADRLAAHRLTVTDVTEALRRENVEIPSGRIEGAAREFTIRTEGQFKTPEEFNELIVAYREGVPVRLADIGISETGVENERTLARFLGKPSVGLGVVKQSKANTVEVADNVKKVVAQLEKALPPGVETRVAYDASIFIKRSIREVKETLFVAGVLVTLVIFLFLRSVRTTVIPALAIPTSIIGTFAVIYFLGFTINNLTMLALVLAIGVVVDDAIVVLENAYRHIEQYGKPPLQAAREATSEIAFAVIATTLSLIAVFVPVAFLQGATGRLFYELGITVAVAVGFSSFVALTLTPVLCSRFLRHQTRHRRVYFVLENIFESISAGYQRWLERALRHRKLIVVAGVAAIAMIGVLYLALRKEFLPVEDKGSFIVFISAPEGATLEYTDQYQRQVEAAVAAIPEVETYFSAIALGRDAPGQPNTGIMFVRLKDWSQRKRSQSAIVRALQPQLFAIPGVLAFPIEPPPLSAGGGWAQKVQFVIQSGDLEQLGDYTEEVLQKLRQIPALVNVDSDLKINKPELRVTIDRNKAADLGVSARDIATTLQVLFGGQDVTRFTRKGDQYDVIVQLRRESRFIPQDLNSVYVRTGGPDAPLVQLSNIVRAEETVGPSQINHYNRLRSATIRANLAPGVTLDEALNTVQRVADETLPPTFTTALAGESREFREGQVNLAFTFFLAILVVYMVLASQFESFLDPFTILLAVPLAVLGAMLTLFVARMSLNLFSVIGMVMLIGLSTKNSILLVDFANQLRAQGVPLLEAAAKAGAIRLRPILMTAISTIFGVLPIALALGAGSQSRRPLGMAVVGGMAVSTLLTLFVVPVVHTLLAEAVEKIRERRVVASAVALGAGAKGASPAGKLSPRSD